jgi:hypothetical protein
VTDDPRLKNDEVRPEDEPDYDDTDTEDQREPGPASPPQEE